MAVVGFGFIKLQKNPTPRALFLSKSQMIFSRMTCRAGQASNAVSTTPLGDSRVHGSDTLK